MGDYEVSEGIGEGEEEEEETPKTPKEQLYRMLETYRAEDLVKLNLAAHSLLKEQKEALKKPQDFDWEPFQRIGEYQERLKSIAKRMQAATARSSAIKDRMQRALKAIEAKTNMNLNES
ncbi:unnamed protein product [Blepharisma stoltei]|uniref:Uncharacterized protein n=1 Tax=Blepharisma stoltei TaxID=1481888 RepID=A0AAU9KNM1_9CILI|nr:unnamed protein product [Blepharisma stoltei]